MFYAFDLVETVSRNCQQEGLGMGAQPERLTIAEAIDLYLEAKKRSSSTRLEYETTKRRWSDWCFSLYLEAKKRSSSTRLKYETTKRRWSDLCFSLRSYRPMAVTECTAEVIESFLEWVYDQAVLAGDKNPGNTHNKYLKNLQAVWRWLARRRKIAVLPLFPERREQRTVAGDHFLTDEEMGRIYNATYRLDNPRRWGNPFSLGKAWRAALVTFRNYGFDTHVLFHKKGVEQLCWRHISSDALPPGRVARVENAPGWIGWKRQKTGAFLILPLEPIGRAHLESLRPQGWQPVEPVFGTSSVGKPNEVFRRLCRWAGVPDKLDIESGDVSNWVLKDLRKTCATMHGPDTGRLMLGHSSGSITEKHYANSVPRLVEAIHKLPQPEAFRAILDPAVKAPELLFSK